MIINPYDPKKSWLYYNNWEKVYNWYLGKEKELPVPITVSLDPCNRCDCHCIGCNAEFVLNKNKGCHLDKQYLMDLAAALAAWGVRGVCLGGGGSAILNPHFDDFIFEADKLGLKLGIVDTGTNALKHIEALKKLKWIGFSVDAATPKTWALIHGVKNLSLFDKVMQSLAELTQAGVHTTYKYLLRAENIHEVYDAVKQAKSIGCKNVHYRPVAVPWFECQNKKSLFSKDEIKIAKEQLERAKEDFPDMNIVGVFSKVGKQWEIVHPFEKCFAVAATLVFQANKVVSYCCDCRGKNIVEMPCPDPFEFIFNVWGSDAHRKLIDKIDVSKCSRCTFSALNSLFHNIIENDFIMKDFI